MGGGISKQGYQNSKKSKAHGSPTRERKEGSAHKEEEKEK